MLLYATFTLVCVVALLVAERRGARRGVWIAKPLASAGFVAAALHLGATETAYGRMLLAGLVLSLAGDVLLVPRGAPRVFLAGVVAFGAAHVAYAAAFLLRGIAPGPVLLAGAVMTLFGLAILRWLWPHLTREWRAPVLGYVAVICTMVTLAAGAAGAPRGTAGAVGAALFAVSDVAVARDRFVSPGFANAAWGLPLYYTAQLVLAGTVRP